MRKAQAAMEFLMTYGWAILVVLAAIGALAYFGVLTPSRYLPSQCTASTGFGCVEYFGDGATDIVVATLTNNGGYDITQGSITIVSNDWGPGAAAYCGLNTNTPPNGWIWTAAQRDDLDTDGQCVLTIATTDWNNGGEVPLNFSGLALESGDHFVADFALSFQREGESVTRSGDAKLNVRLE
ncbi:hypothetical protein JW868_00365 [Candidatus Woesearchaeota archaeon]|nr:hypothetical protein [Candidatus Woesearchaeota archaeon]